MAKEQVKERLLRQFIPPVVVGVEGSSFTNITGGGWRIVNAVDTDGNPTYWAVYRTYFDLSGIVIDQATLFTVNPMFQEGCDWNYTTSLATGALQVWDLITQEYIDDDTFDGVLAGSGNWIAPGLTSGKSTLGSIRVHYGNARSFQYGAITALGGSPFLPNQTRSSSWGAGSASAGQKLYVTRAFHLSSALNPELGNEIVSPPTAVVVPALIAKETDLRYIERLRRSYVVQGVVD